MAASFPFYRGKHVVSAKDFDRPALEKLFLTTAMLKMVMPKASPVRLSTLRTANGTPLRCRILYEGASTRTVSSFEDAIEALGGTVLSQPLVFSSRAKGETLRSTARILGPRSDVIIIRDDGEIDAAKKMADAVEDYELPTVIINAGDGNKEHPTQMLLDLFTIWERRKEKLESGGLVYALVGDLADSRTIHSLLLGLGHFGGRVFLVGPEEQNIPRWLWEELRLNTNLLVFRVVDPLVIASLIDVWYFTRLQANLKERQPSEEQKEFYAKKYGASPDLRKLMKQEALVLHPLPHGHEYPDGIDLLDPRFIHYHQADNGFFVRMALLKILFGFAAAS